jgi:hypothetical protein
MASDNEHKNSLPYSSLRKRTSSLRKRTQSKAFRVQMNTQTKAARLDALNSKAQRHQWFQGCDKPSHPSESAGIAAGIVTHLNVTAM